jgi:hypothetical protein
MRRGQRWVDDGGCTSGGSEGAPASNSGRVEGRSSASRLALASMGVWGIRG